MSDTQTLIAIPTITPEKEAAEARKSSLRAAIDRQAEQPSREGVLADVLAYFVTQQAQAAVAIANANSIADIKVAFAEQANIGQTLLDLMANGQLVFPYQAKKLDGAGILADLVKVSNGVSSALAQAASSA